MADFYLFAWIIGGSRRVAILKALERPMPPWQVHKKSKDYSPKISLNHTSDTLREFQQQGIATCINPQNTKGRIYQLTQKGEEIRNELMKG
jgi:DNA-binding HxlR family transcriptional regulator